AAASPARAEKKTWDRLANLRAGDQLEVVTAAGAGKGAFVSSSTESLTIRDSAGERKFPRAEIVRVTARSQSRRLRNLLIGVGAGVAIGLITDQTLGTRIRNENSSDPVLSLLWVVPIGIGAGVGAAIPSYP